MLRRALNWRDFGASRSADPSLLSSKARSFAMQEILLNVEKGEMRCAHLKNGALHNLAVERKHCQQLKGNIYKGQVTNVLGNIQSAFVNIGEGESGFIHLADIAENTRKLEEMFDMDFEMVTASTEDQASFPRPDIRELFNVDKWVLVQVVKEPIGTKGARLTSNISLAGRYVVLVPNAPHRAISRKIEQPAARERLRSIVKSLELPPHVGIVCRTASQRASQELIELEAIDLLRQWTEIVDAFHATTQPRCLYRDADLVKKAVLTSLDWRVDRLKVDDQEAFEFCRQICEKYIKEHPIQIEHYQETLPLFERFGVEPEIEKALRRKIWLPSGGYLFFDKTEAMHTIDVNSGRSTCGDRDLEEALVQINLEAASELSRQLRLRNIGGLIICDFIDMRSKAGRRRVLEKLKDCMRQDAVKCTILSMSDFGLVEMTRQRSRESLAETLLSHCPYCSGTGLVKTHETVSIELERAIKKVISNQGHTQLKLTFHPQLQRYLDKEGLERLRHLAQTLGARLSLHFEDSLHINDFYFAHAKSSKRIEV